MLTTRELRATACTSLEKVRTLDKEYTDKYGKGYLKDANFPADCRDSISSASRKYKDDHSALTAAEADRDRGTQEILDAMGTSTLTRDADDPAPRTRGKGKSKSGGRQGGSLRSKNGRPSRRSINWKPDGSRHARTLMYEGENPQARHDVLMAELMPEHPLAVQTARQHEDYNVLIDEIDSKGGFLTASEKLVAGILKNVDDDVFMLRMARSIFLEQAKSLATMVRTDKANAFGFTNALTDVTDRMENSLKYGKKAWTPHDIMGAFWIHRDLMENASVSPVALMLEEMDIDFRELLEYALLFEDGIAQSTDALGNIVSHPCPIGVMYPAANAGVGITTGRDITYGTTTTAFTGDSFIKAKYNQKRAYRGSSTWMMHRDIIASAATLKDTTGQYIWRQGLTENDPDRLVGRPIEESEWMPNTAGASNYFAILGDFSWYWVVWSKRMEMKRLDEIAARQNLVEYHFRAKMDGKPAKEEAFTRLKYAAS